jgi:hypothetical protein
MARPARLRLSVGAATVQRVLAVLAASVTVSVGLFLVGIMVAVVRDEVLKQADEWIVTLAVTIVVLVPSLYVLGAVTILLLSTVTSGTWLSGTTLRQRVVLRTTSVDLATADIERGPLGKTLIARDPISGSTVTVPLREGSLRLPSAELRAIADAISPGGTARVTSTDDPVAVADELRVLARS